MSLPQPSDFDPRPLPQQNPFLEANIHAAFNLCLSLESRANLVPLPHARHPPVLLCARVLGYTLIEAPTTAGRDHMVYAINVSSSDENLLALSNHYIQRLLRIFKRVKGRTLASSQHPSPPDVDDVPDFYQHLLQQASLNHSTAKKAALFRDGFHCMLKTDMYDLEYFDKNFSTLLAQNQNCDSEPLKCAHIFLEGLNSDLGEDIESSSDKHEWVASVWDMMHMFGIEIEELDGTGIHRLENILTLCSGLRDYFDKLALWLQAVNDQPNTYVVVSTSPGTLRRLPSRVVTFTTPNPQTLPLPSSEYLAIHAACCRIARMSGAAEYVENVLREEEDIHERAERMGLLAEDGSLSELFNHYMTAAIRVP